MALDATGTPTSKGIPTYNVSVDNPSGQGFNATMAVIDGLLGWAKVRKNSTGTVFSRSRLNLIEGSNITVTVADDATDNEIDVTIASTAAGPGYGTSLPGSPTDGQEYILVDSTTAPTYAWRFRYNAGSASAYKWEFVGGSPAMSFNSGGVVVSAQTSYTDNNGPSFTIPRAGDYDITIGGAFGGWGDDVSKAAYLSYAIGATPASDSDAWIAGVKVVQEVLAVSGSQTRRKTGLSASDLIEERTKVNASTGATWTIYNRHLTVVPVRVS
jgi:hypothetical protein